MDLFLFITLLTVTSASILAYVLAKNGGLRNRSRLLFFFFLLDFIIWTVLNYFSLQPDLAPYTLWILRVLMVFALTQTVLIYLFAKNFPHKELVLSKKLMISVTIIYVIVALVSLSPLLFSAAIWRDNILTDIPGPGIYLFGIVTFFLIAAATSTLIKKYRIEHGIVKQQVLYLLLGEVVMFCLLFFLNFVAVVWFQNYFFIPFGGLPVLFFVAVTTYAITRYRLFGIKFILQRFIINALTFLAPLLLYGVIAFILHGPVLKLPEPTNVYINFLIVVIVVSTFNSIRSFVHKFLAKLFERETVLTSELMQATQSGDDQIMIKQITSQYLPWLASDQVGIAMFKSDNALYTFYPPQENFFLAVDDNVIRLIQEHKNSIVVTEELGWQIEQGNMHPNARQLHEHLVNSHIAAVVKLMSDHVCIGLILIKDSPASSTFAAEDIIALQKCAVMLLPVIRHSLILAGNKQGL